MKTQEAELLLGSLMAAWPWASWPDATVALFRTELERFGDLDVAAKVVETLIQNCERPPSIALLRGDYEAREKRLREQRARLRALPEAPAGPLPPELVAQIEAFLGRPLVIGRSLDVEKRHAA